MPDTQVLLTFPKNCTTESIKECNTGKDPECTKVLDEVCILTPDVLKINNCMKTSHLDSEKISRAQEIIMCREMVSNKQELKDVSNLNYNDVKYTQYYPRMKQQWSKNYVKQCQKS